MLSRLRTFSGRAVGLFPLTLPGALALALSAWALRAIGIGHEDHVVLVISAVGLAILAASALATVLGAVVVWLRLRSTPPAPPLELEVGLAGRTGFALAPPWFVPLLHVEWSMTSPAGDLHLVRRGRVTTESFTPLRRGRFDVVRRWVVVGDGFGLTSVAFPWTERRDVRFLPSTGALKNIHVIQGMSGGDVVSHPEGTPTGDMVDIRNYGDGDPIRYVLWKVFAKSRDLVVRTPERALSPVKRTVAYLVAAPGDQAAAGAARVAIEGGALGEQWTLGVDGTPEEATTRAHALELLVRSATCAPEDGGRGLRAFLDGHDRTGTRRAVVFVPPTPGPWLDLVVAAASGPGRLEVVVCADGILPAHPSLLGRAVLRPDGGPPAGHVQTTRAELAAVCRRLAAVGDVLVVDRQAGALYPASHLQALIRSAA